MLRGINSGSIKKAEKILSQGEDVAFAVLCSASVVPVAGKLKVFPASAKSKSAGAFVVTNHRLLWCSSILGSGVSRSIQISDITSVGDTYHELLQAATLRIQGITEMFVLDLTKKEHLSAVAAIERVRRGSAMQISPDVKNEDYTAELERLADLHAKGILTPEEFSAKKKQLLGL